MTSIVQTLDGARELITPLLRKMVHRLDPSTRLVVSYHLGWCDEHGIPVNTNGGKAIRPAVALIGCASGRRRAGKLRCPARSPSNWYTTFHSSMTT